MATRTQTITDLLTMTADNYYKSGVIHDAFFKSSPTVQYFRKGKGRHETQGGNQILTNLMYAKNDTVKSYSRYEPFDVSPQEGFRPAYYDWAQYPGTVSIDGLSEFQNAGKPQIQKLLREKVEQLTMSFSEKINEDLWDLTGDGGTNGNGGKNINSIPTFVHYDPTASVSIGGIDQSTDTWWRNQFTAATTTSSTFAIFNKELRNLANNCGKGSGGMPDLYVADQAMFELYEAGMDSKVRYQASDDATMGFENISYKGGKIFWDEHVPDASTNVNWDGSVLKGTIYALNSNFMKLVVGKGKDFAPLGFQRPANQDARVGAWVWYGQLICSNRRKQGVIGAIDITTTD